MRAQLFCGLLVALPFAKAALNIGLDRFDLTIQAKLNEVRKMIYVDRQHLQSATKDKLASRFGCSSSDGPCRLLKYADSTQDSDDYEDPASVIPSPGLEVNGVLPLRFLGRNAIEVDRWQREFVDSVVGGEGTVDDDVTLHDQLRTLGQIEGAFDAGDADHGWHDWRSFGPVQLELEDIPLGSPLSRFEIDDNGPGAYGTWEGAWVRGPGPSAQLVGGLGYIRFGRKMLITSLPMRPCGGKPALKVLVVGRQGLSIVWEHVVSLSECATTTGWYDLMEFNSTLLSVDELMIVSVLGRDLCLGSFETRVYPKKLEMSSKFKVRLPEHAEGGVEDLDHEVLLLYPGSVTQRYTWNFQPIRVSSSALSRLVSVSAAHKAGLKMKTFSEQDYKCSQSSAPSDTEAFRLGRLLLHGDNPRYDYEPLRAPELSGSSRTELLKVLDNILRTPSGVLGEWARDLTIYASTARAALLSCRWQLEDGQTCVSPAVAEHQQRALDAIIAALFQAKQLQPEKLWKAQDTNVSSQFEVLEELSYSTSRSDGPFVEDGCTANKICGSIDVVPDTSDVPAGSVISSGTPALIEAVIVFSCLASSVVITCFLRSRRRATRASMWEHKIE